MDITIKFENGKLSVTPDPAVVAIGTPVTWLVRIAKSNLSLLRWTVYFRKGSPFYFEPGILIPDVTTSTQPKLTQLRVTTRNLFLGTGAAKNPHLAADLEAAGVRPEDIVDHAGTAGPAIPREPEDYKYGVRLVNAENGEQIDDEDPYLVVR